MNISAVTIIACISLPKASWPAAAAAAAAAAAHSALQPSTQRTLLLCPDQPGATSADASLLSILVAIAMQDGADWWAQGAAAGTTARGVYYSPAWPPLLPSVGPHTSALLGRCRPPRLPRLHCCQGSGLPALLPKARLHAHCPAPPLVHPPLAGQGSLWDGQAPTGLCCSSWAASASWGRECWPSWRSGSWGHPPWRCSWGCAWCWPSASARHARGLRAVLMGGTCVFVCVHAHCQA